MQQRDAAANHWANLEWACSTPHIATDARLPWLPAGRLAALGDFFRSGATRRRLQPELEATLAASTSPRLGVYFEDLWSFIFRHHPDYQLVARNLPLRCAGRTLGELDFVVRYLPDGVFEHWEIAVKFYLQVRGSYWVGPGLRDRLDTKLARMAEHQLPVAGYPESRSILAREGIHIDRQWTLMPGRLFRPLEQQNAPLHQSPTPVNPASCHYWWATAEQFIRQFEARALAWCRLPKRTWLADYGYRPGVSYDCDALARTLANGEGKPGMQRPVCVAGRDDSGEASRGFLVPGNWQARVLDSL
ncbi:DUF1853 family protein [Microbulbifer yueqingensis]|uniref:DUF1853 domain-containing protein n=1 Tax=Microbulbifer yueqingensis TaxID=658219 RepID=A0A1G8XSL7_9GAMM|nr:DUF1853 family protein [Microbulbifer yueqingensis]SDJ93579.1 hypothetical protein SAMN05216212_1225 [Microbulbifer yueqingensis]